MKNFKFLLFCTLSTLCFSASAQVLELKPTASTPLNFSPATDAAWRKLVANNGDESALSASELAAIPNNGYASLETKENQWDPIGMGCSWYCGIGVKSVRATSELPSQGSVSYSAQNAHNFNYREAWAEGVEGVGIGECLIYTFEEKAPRITRFIIANGYVKSEKAWRENSRVKTLRVYINDEHFATLHLQDERSEQEFSIDPIGKGPEAGRERVDWELKFEIAEVYQGAKYDDTVISELYFDGIDVH